LSSQVIDQTPAAVDAEPKAETQVAPTPEAKRRRGFSWAGLIALAALGLIAWLWWDTRAQFGNLQQELGRRLADADEGVKKNRALADQALELARESQSKLAVLDNKVTESQNQQVALEALYQELSRNREDWVVAEVEQMLNIASQQLKLAGNVPAALVALQVADQRVQRIDRPELISLRRALDQDIQRLRALPFVDTVGISVRIDNMIGGVDALPLAQYARPGAQAQEAAPLPPANYWTKLALDVWGEVKQLVRVQHLEKAEAPLLSPEQSYFLRENLKLRLLSARLALLTRDEASYKADLDAAQKWLERYFDTRAKPVENAGTTLRQLAENSISIAVPDISASLEAAREAKATREGPMQ
jgi:uroporphyrin-III C-methyltransferase